MACLRLMGHPSQRELSAIYRYWKCIPAHRRAQSWPWNAGLFGHLPLSNSAQGGHRARNTGQGICCLQALVLDDNKIAEWRSLRPLHALSSLSCLSLSDNCIAAIPAEELSKGTNPAWRNPTAPSPNLPDTGNPALPGPAGSQGVPCFPTTSIRSRLSFTVQGSDAEP